MCYPNDSGHPWARRHYYANAERVAWLEAYARELENELAGVRERIAWLSDEDDEEGDEA